MDVPHGTPGGGGDTPCRGMTHEGEGPSGLYPPLMTHPMLMRATDISAMAANAAPRSGWCLSMLIKWLSAWVG